MPDSSRKPGEKPEFSQKIFLRRGDKVIKDFPARLLIQAIKNGKLLPTDEYSRDGKQWVKLGAHRQVSEYFRKKTSSTDRASAKKAEEKSEESPNLPPGFDRELKKLADMLKEIDSGF